jgi:hypothetical protein
MISAFAVGNIYTIPSLFPTPRDHRSVNIITLETEIKKLLFTNRSLLGYV